MIRDSLLHEQARNLIEKCFLIQRTSLSKSTSVTKKLEVEDLWGRRNGIHKGPDVSICMSPKCDANETSNLLSSIDIKRMESGSELRTTLMIKKVPRKYSNITSRRSIRRYTLQDLRKEIDNVLSIKAAYDLLYLPVDSAKMTNRGYAFINFTSSKYVEVFAREFVNRPWSELNRRGKIAALHWAYVQGRDETLAHIKTEVMND